jgi:4'-phosphopantetheinyl transferase EntD
LRPRGPGLRSGQGDDPFALHPFTPPGPADDDLVCTRFDLPVTPGDAEMLADLASASLAPEEVLAWDRFRSPKRRREWLMGRIAAKEAVRLRLTRADSPPPSRRDIVIRADERGRPSLEIAIDLSIAHTEGVAVAAASTRAAGLGIDVERLDRRRGDYERAAFMDDERRRLDEGTADRRAERALRLFCAKEAAAKATGLGLMGSPHNLHLVDCDAGLTRIELRAAGRLAEALAKGAPAQFGAADRTAVAWVGAGAGLVIALSRRGGEGRS